MKIDITVVVCLYNAEKYIVETLRSLQQQTLKEFKLLIIDDCSTDSSVKKVEVFLAKKKLNYTQLVTLKKNRGTAYVRNYALHYVTTPLILFFDADDLAKPDLLKKLYTKIKDKENYIAVSCYSKYINEHSRKIAGGHFIGPLSEEEFKFKAENGKLILIPNVTLFDRQKAIEAGGYRQKGFPAGKIRYQDLSEDLDLWSRMSDFYTENNCTIITIPEVLFYYRKITSSLSASKLSLIGMQNKIRFIKRNLKLRRAGKEEIDFIAYMKSFTLCEKLKYYFIDNSAFYYRKAGFLYVRGSYLGFLFHISLSAILNPFYIIDKLKSNVL